MSNNPTTFRRYARAGGASGWRGGRRSWRGQIGPAVYRSAAVSSVWNLSGVTRDSVGIPIGGCRVELLLTATDAPVKTLTSDAFGNFTFIEPGIGPFYIVAYKVGSPDVAGTTVNTLVSTKPAGGLIPVGVIISFGQSWDAPARDDVAELPGGQSFSPNDNNANVWNVATQTIQPLKYGTIASGGNEQQPGNAYLDSSYQNIIGYLPEFIRRLRASGYSGRVDYFGYAVGGSQFTDGSSFGRTGNWDTALTDGAYAATKNNWVAYKAAMNASGYDPVPMFWHSGLGISTASFSAGASTFQTDMGSLIAGLRTAFLGNCKGALLRCPTIASGSYKSTVRAAQVALVKADPTKLDLLNGDVIQTDSATLDHPTAAGMAMIGFLAYHSYVGLWHPATEITELDDRANNQTSYWVRSGEIANTLTSGEVSSAFDYSGAGRTMNSPSTRRPIPNTTGLSRGATFDITDCFRSSSPLAHAQATGASIYAAMKLVNPGGGGYNALYCEASNASFQPFYAIETFAAGDIRFGYRDDSGTLVQLSLQSNAWNNSLNAIAVHDLKTTIQGVVNGSAGSAQSYTRSTLTLDTQTINIQESDNSFSNAGVGNVPTLWITSAPSDATQKANALAFLRREYGTL